MITERRALARLSVVRMTINAAVPEHSICTAGTSSNEARPSSSVSVVAEKKSRQRSGSPAVGGTSCRWSGRFTMLRLAEAQQNDAGDDAGGAGDLSQRQVLAKHQNGDDEHRYHFHVRCGEGRTDGRVFEQRHPGDERAEIAGDGAENP